ncbi:hypothetical protein GVN16_22265 [Emticicia sp. CRIBPO]|uniref:lysoplasmalogenase family protein n=1 Tax=Emticicia sp. CRIBPO TaxID=2683258 RepID=UPI001412F264|nr:lysoplasmalogenase family protein [Emticicia sp. CRIBPO]NBA88515.1 hypothetical protein [Emticicia sp. CRIBPO]
MKRKELYILGALTFIEIVSYHFLPMGVNFLFKPLPSLFIIYTYWARVKDSIGIKEQLFFTSFLFSILGEFAFNFRAEVLGLMLVLLFYLIEHQLYIMIFRREKAIAYGIEHSNYFQKGLPYIIISFIFFGVFLMNSVPDRNFIMVLLYVVQLAILGTLSLLRPAEPYSKTIIIVAIAVNTFSDAISSIHLFVGHFALEYSIIRVTFVASKYMMAIGLAQKSPSN